MHWAAILLLLSGEPPVVHAAERGRPWVNLADGREIAAHYEGDAEGARAVVEGRAEPISLETRDVDGDGTPDLVVRYAYEGRGILVVHRGNPEVLFPHGWKAGEPFFDRASVTLLPEARERPDRTQGITGAKVSSLPGKDVITVDRARRTIRITTRARASTRPIEPESAVSLDVDGEPVDVLPMRLNRDALDDLVILVRGRSAPVVVRTLANQVFTVTKTTPDINDDPTTLDGAIKAANLASGSSEIRFNVPGAGVHTFRYIPTAMRRTILLDGTTQPGYTPAQPLIEISPDPSSYDFPAIEIVSGADHSRVTGIIVNRRDNGPGIGVSASQCQIDHNFVGTDATGTVPAPNRGGVRAAGFRTTVNDNLVAGNLTFGIQLTDESTVQGNTVGGARALGNGGNGIDVSPGGSQLNSIGGTAPAAGNTISWNAAGVSLCPTCRAYVVGNAISDNLGSGIVSPLAAPVLESAVAVGSLFRIHVSIPAASVGGQLHLYSSPSCDASGSGEGLARSAGFASTIFVPLTPTALDVDLDPSTMLPGGRYVTAAMTEDVGTSPLTSSFSNCVAVGTPPRIVVPPASVNGEIGRPTTLSVTAEGEAPLAYQWYEDGAPVGGATAAAYTITSVAATHAYTVRVSSPYGSVLSDRAVVTAVCIYRLTPIVRELPAAGAADQPLDIGTTCAWSVTAPPWVHLSKSSGVGSGSLTYSVGHNIGPYRSGVVDVSGTSHEVRQLADTAYVYLITDALRAYTGGSVSVRARAIANNDSAPNVTVTLTVTGGPNAGALASGATDALGFVTLQYSGSATPGQDQVAIGATLEGVLRTGRGTVDWIKVANPTCSVDPPVGNYISYSGTVHTFTVYVKANATDVAASPIRSRGRSRSRTPT